MASKAPLFDIYSDSAEKTRDCGSLLAQKLIEDPSLPRFICLCGDLGTGKTVFASGLVSRFDPRAEVTSPTYTVVNEYIGGKIPVYHFDVYRIKDGDDLYSTGYYDYPDDGITLVEWADLIGYALPPERIEVRIEKTGAGTGDLRHITAQTVKE
jgi:ATPase, YjeE family